MQTIAELLAQELGASPVHVQNVIDLLDQGNTIPFIARYRKELHGSMDDTALRKLEDRLNYLRNLDQRRQEVKSAIEGQEKLTPELAAAIDSARTLAEVEDLYRPYKQKRRTRATVAREKGLAPLAELLLAQRRDCPDPMQAAQGFIDPEKGVETAEDALQGASDILAEEISDDADIRRELRQLYLRRGMLASRAAAKEPEDTVYRLYYDFKVPVGRAQGHQVLAVNRGEREGVLKVSVEMEREAALIPVRRAVLNPGAPAMAFVRAAELLADDRIAAKLGISAGTPLLRISRLCTADGRPAIYCEDMVEKSRLRRVYTNAELRQPIFGFLQEVCGISPYMDLTDLRPLTADAFLADIFQVPQGTPLLNMDEVDYDIDGVPVFVSSEYFADGIFRHTVLRKKL